MSETTTTVTPPALPDPATERLIERFLYEEAHLLDSWRFTDWLDMLAPDLRYEAPVRENRLYRERRFETSAPGTSAYFEEDFAMMRERVDRLQTHMAWAEEPPSRTRHLVTNVLADLTEDEDEYAVRSNLCLYRTRGERDEDVIYARRQDLLRRTDTGWGFQIARRTVVFDQATLLVKNLSSFY